MILKPGKLYKVKINHYAVYLTEDLKQRTYMPENETFLVLKELSKEESMPRADFFEILFLRSEKINYMFFCKSWSSYFKEEKTK